MKEKEKTSGLLRITDILYTIYRHDGGIFRIRDAVAYPHGWFPLLYLGCAPLPQMECGVGFVRGSGRSLGRTQNGSTFESPLTRALGLKPVRPEDRHVPDSATGLALLANTRQEVVERELGTLDAVLNNVGIEVDTVPFGSLRARQDLLQTRLSRMVDAIETGVAQSAMKDDTPYADRDERYRQQMRARTNSRNNAQQLFNLLLSLPPGLLIPYGSRLEKLQAKDDWFVYPAK